MNGQNTEETQDGKLDFKPGLRAVSFGAVTREGIEVLILSAEQEGVAESELVALKALLQDLLNNTVSLPEPETTYFERKLPNGEIEVFFATTQIENPEEAMKDIELVSVETGNGGKVDV